MEAHTFSPGTRRQRQADLGWGASLLYRVSSMPFLGYSFSNSGFYQTQKKFRLKWLNTGKEAVRCKQMAVTNVQGLGTQPSWKKFCWEAEVVPFTVLFFPLAVADLTQLLS